jgi:hypothetical protein
MPRSKRVKLSAASYTEQLPPALVSKIMGYYKELLIPGIQFSKYSEELRAKAHHFQKRLHSCLDNYDMPASDYTNCHCDYMNAEFVLMCKYDTIDRYEPEERVHTCVACQCEQDYHDSAFNRWEEAGFPETVQ